MPNDLYKEKSPKLTYALIAICFLVFIGEIFYGYTYGEEAIDDVFRNYGFSLSSLLEGNWRTPITSVFLHASADHLILNMLALFFFGRAVELSLGKKKFLLIFFGAAIVGSCAVLLATIFGLMPANIPTVGASAAIFGLMGTAMLVKPFELIFYPYLIPVPLILVALLYTLYNIVAFAAVLITGIETEVAYIAHLGGLFAGAYFGFKEEGAKKGLLILLLIALILIAIPFFWWIFSYLEVFNYIAAVTGIFG